MKSALLTLFFAACMGVASAQAYYPEPVSQTDYFRFGEWTQETKTAVIFADVCNVRSAADPKAEVTGKLSIGTSVQILEVSTVTHTQSGIKAPWVKVKTAALTGYVWGGLLTNNSVRLADGKQLVWGLIDIRESKEDEDQDSRVTASVRLLDKGVLVDKHDFPVKYASRAEEGYLEVYAAPQLKGVQNMIVFATPSEACGVTASQHYFLYAGGKLVFVGSGYGMGDGGALHVSLDYVFPYPKPEDEYGDYHYTPDPEHIIRIENEGSFNDDCDWVETTKARNFTWNPSEAILTKFCEW